jgi:hypothetical protein
MKSPHEIFFEEIREMVKPETRAKNKMSPLLTLKAVYHNALHCYSSKRDEINGSLIERGYISPRDSIPFDYEERYEFGLETVKNHVLKFYK